MQEPDPMIDICGDTHGDYAPIFKWITSRPRIHGLNSVLLHVGDVGVGFAGWEKQLARLGQHCDDALEAFGWQKNIFMIRGNHDDPAPFAEGRSFGPVQLLPDFSILKLQKQSILCVGGAHSIDREWRVQNKAGWWEGEPFTLKGWDEAEIDRAQQMGTPIKHVITHSACRAWTGKNFLKPSRLVMDFASRDVELLDDLDTESILHRKLYDRLRAKHIFPETWHFGHFHQRHIYEDVHMCKFRMMAVNEITPLEL